MNKCVPGVSVLDGIVVSPPAGTKLSGGPGSPVVGFMKNVGGVVVPNRIRLRAGRLRVVCVFVSVQVNRHRRSCDFG